VRIRVEGVEECIFHPLTLVTRGEELYHPPVKGLIILHKETLVCGKGVGYPIQTTGQKLRYYMHAVLVRRLLSFSLFKLAPKIGSF
jgi:hypothetical protein